MADMIRTERLLLRPLQVGVQAKLGFVRDGETTLHARPRGGDFPHINTVLMRSAFEALAQ